MLQSEDSDFDEDDNIFGSDDVLEAIDLASALLEHDDLADSWDDESGI